MALYSPGSTGGWGSVPGGRPSRMNPPGLFGGRRRGGRKPPGPRGQQGGSPYVTPPSGPGGSLSGAGGGTGTYTPGQGAYAPEVSPGGAPPGGFDLSADPILQQVLAANQAALAGAQGRALMDRQQLAVALGDPELARALGLGEDFATAAGANPFSQFANLRRGYEDKRYIKNEDLNKQNLFYSSHRGKELADLATALQQSQAGAVEAAQLGPLAEIARALLEAQTGATSAEAGARGEAMERALAASLREGGAASNAAAAKAQPPPKKWYGPKPPKKGKKGKK